jgi:hypothetical protein
VSTTGLTVPGGYPQELVLISRELGKVPADRGVAMARRLTRQGFVVGACLLTFLGTACTPSDPATPTPSSTAPVASPTPAENDQEREQRLAYEAAETSYREFRAEYYEVLGRGGSKSATSKMKATAGGPYLKEATEVVQAYRGLHNRSSGRLQISRVRGNGYTPTDLILSACEDSTKIAYLNSKGKVTGHGELRVVELTVRRVSGSWHIWSGSGKKVSACED